MVGQETHLLPRVRTCCILVITHVPERVSWHRNKELDNNEPNQTSKDAEREGPEQPKNSCVLICTKQIATLILIL